MGLAKNQKHEKMGKKDGRGSTNNASRLDAFNRASSATGADWGSCDPRKLQTVVVQITALGGAITFGLSRDKGAHMLTLLLDGAKQTLWFNGDAELDAELDEVAATLEAMS